VIAAAPAEVVLPRERRLAALVAGLVLVVGYVPLAFLGPGTDLDVGGVWRAGQAILDGGYQVSRTPGSPVFEAVAGVLYAVGGSALVNLASVAAAAATALGLVRLLQRDGITLAPWFGVAFLVHPVVWIAGTSMVDFLWATALIVWGALLQRERPMLAGVLYGLATGCRLSSLAVIGAFLLGDALVADRDRRRRLALTALVAAAVTVVAFVPPYRDLGWDFLRSEVPGSGVVVQLGRWGVKNLFVFGPLVVVGVLVVLPRLATAIRDRWSTSATLRMAALAFLASELVFLRFPWKLAHLVPAVLALVLVLGASGVVGRRGVALLIGAHLLLGVVNVQVAEPDTANAASGARFAPAIVEGQLVRDVRCRIDGDRDAYRRDDGAPALAATWDCAVPFAGDGR